METKITLRNKIANLTRQNIDGQYTERIAQFQKQLATMQNDNSPIVAICGYSEADLVAIPLFNKDRRFLITE